MEAGNQANDGRTIYLIISIATFFIAFVAKLFRDRSNKAALLDAWLEQPKNLGKLRYWLIVGFFFFVFGGLTLYYELNH